MTKKKRTENINYQEDKLKFVWTMRTWLGKALLPFSQQIRKMSKFVYTLEHKCQSKK